MALKKKKKFKPAAGEGEVTSEPKVKKPESGGNAYAITTKPRAISAARMVLIPSSRGSWREGKGPLGPTQGAGKSSANSGRRRRG